MNIKNFLLAIAVSAALLAAGCSTDSSDSEDSSGGSTSTSQTVAVPASTVPGTAASSTVPETQAEVAEVSVVVPFATGNGTGTVTVSGDASPVAAWFASQPGEVSLDLVDADVGDAVSVVEELVSFWFFQDDRSGDVPPYIYVSGSGEITDSLGTSYAVEAQLLPPAPVAEITTATSYTTSTTISTTTASTTSSAPTESSETTTPSSTSTSVAPTTTSTTSTTIVAESPVILQVQVLNGSGVAGAAGRLTAKLAEAGYTVLPASNAPQRYSSSAVYYQEGWQAKAEEVLAATEIDEIEQVAAMPQVFVSEQAAVVVLIGRDTAPAAVRSSGPEPIREYFLTTKDFPLNVPKDRFSSRAFGASYNFADVPEYFDRASALMQQAAYCFEDEIAYFEDNCLENDLPAIWTEIEQLLDRSGFTSKNVCGSVADGSFTDGIVHTAEWNPATKNYGGYGISSTGRFLEVNRQAGISVARINPAANLDFYLRKAAQSAYDRLRFEEIMKETSADHLILCAPWVTGSGSMPWAAYSVANTFAVPVREFWSQSTYNIKEISRNGNLAYVVACHPTLGSRFLLLWWSGSGYRANTVEDIRTSGCQAAFEEYDDLFAGTVPDGAGNYFTEDTFSFTFGERSFAASELLDFPRASG